MKDKTLVFLMVCLVVSLCILPVLAQEEQQKTQLYYAEEVVVKLSMISDHESAIKKMVEYSTEHNYPYPWYAYSTDEFHYYYIFPVEDLAKIARIGSAWGEVAKKIGMEKLQSLMKKYHNTYESNKYWMFRSRPDLSYAPEIEGSKADGSNFMFWGIGYILPGREREVEDIFRQWVALYKSQKISSGFDTFFGDIGVDLPLIFWTMSGKSAGDFFSQHEKDNNKLGLEKVMPLWMKTLSLFRKYEYKLGMPRPDLSYIPKKIE